MCTRIITIPLSQHFLWFNGGDIDFRVKVTRDQGVEEKAPSLTKHENIGLRLSGWSVCEQRFPWQHGVEDAQELGVVQYRYSHTERIHWTEGEEI